MSQNIEKVGVELFVNNASGYISTLGKAKSAIEEFGKSAKSSVKDLGSGSLALEKYKATMKSLEAEMGASKIKISDLKKQYEDLKKSNEKLPSSIEKVSKKYEEKRKTLSEVKKAMDDQQKTVDSLAKTHKRGSSELVEARSKLKDLKSEYSSGKKEVKSLEQEVKTLNDALNKHEKELSQLPSKIKQAEAGYDSLKAKVRETHTEFRNGGGKFKDFADKVTNTGEALSNAGSKLNGWGNSLTVATAGIAYGMKYAGNAAIQFESDFAGVIKTVDATPDELDKIRESFLNLSTEIPVTANELAKIGETAGQLGIRTENIVDFTKVMADLSVATNLTSEQAATSLSQFMAVMDTSQDKVSNLGSSIVNLGNNFATSESKIVDMSLRLAPMGQLVNMREADVLGLAAAMSTVGIEAEAGGTAMTMVMKKMQNAVFEGGNSLETFSKVAGVSAENFSSAFKNRPVEALEMVLKGLKKTKDEGGNVNEVLSELGVTGVRESLAVNALAGALNGDKGLTKALDIANKGFNENTALQKEASTRYETTASKVQIAKNEINKIAIEIGNRLLPNVVKVLKNSKPLIKTLGDLAVWFSKLPPTVQLAVVGMGPFLKFLGTSMSMAGGLTKGIGSLVRWLGKITTAKAATELATLSTSAAKSAQSITSIGSAATQTGGMATLLSNPYVLAGAAITGAFVGVGYTIYSEMTKHSREHEISVEATNGKYQEWFDGVIKGAETSGKSIDGLSDAVKRNKEEVVKATQEINTRVNETYRELWSGDEYFGLQKDSPLRQKLKEQLMLSDEDINEIRDKMQGSVTMISNSIGSVMDSYARHETITRSFADSQITAMREVTDGIVTSLKEREQAEISSLEKSKINGTMTEAEYQKQAEIIKGAYSNMTGDAQNAFGIIKDIMVKSSQEGRSLSEAEMLRLQMAYNTLSDGMAKSATKNKDAQEALSQAIREVALSSQMAALKQAGVLTPEIENQIQSLGKYEDKLKVVNEAMMEIARNDKTVRLNVEYNGENIVFKWKTEMEMAAAMPDITKTIAISEESGRSIEMTRQQLEALNALGINPKNVVIVDDNASRTVETVKGKVIEYNNVNIPNKTLMAEDSASGVVKVAQGNLDKFNSTKPDHKQLKSTDGASANINTAKTNLDRFNSTIPHSKHLTATENVSGVSQSVISWIDSIPSYKRVYIEAVTGGGGVSNSGYVGVFANGGHIDMYATGGNIGTTQWLNRGYQGIVGEAGPELFTVTKRGVNITPLSTREKIQGITGKLKGDNSNNNPININFYISDNIIKEEADEDRIVGKIEKMLIRTMKEREKGIGGSRNVYSI